MPRLLREADWPVQAHDDHFSHDTKDPDLLRALGQRDWVLLTQDQRIRYRTPERNAYMAAGLRVFVITSGNLTGPSTAEILLKARKGIEKTCEDVTAPFVFSVRKDSSLRRLD